MKKITVLLAEDHQLVREGFRSLLKHEPDILVVGEAANGRQAVALVKKLRPAVVLMDIAMPLLNGMEATRQVLQAAPTTRVLILSAHSDEAYLDRVVELGAAGYLLKQASSHELAMAIRTIHEGKTFFSPDFAKRRSARHPAPARRDLPFKTKRNQLSSREVEVLQLIAEGKPNKQVALELGISFKTVDKHRQHLMGKLNIHDIAGLTRYAIAQGMIESNVQLAIK